MMWDLSGGSHSSAPSIAMPVPSHKTHRGRPVSMPGLPPPARAPSPMPVSSPYLTAEAFPEPISRGFLTPSPQPTHHHHHHHRHHSHSPSGHRRHHSEQPAQQPAPVVHHRPPPVVRPVAVQHRLPPPPPRPTVHPQYQYSKCTGRRRALCIGINYHGQPHELRGCINDAKHVYSFLVRRYGYKPEDVVMLTDDSPHARAQPTRKNMIDAMHWLVSDARPNDSLFFHYSGHGGQTRDLDGDEVDGYDEVIFPVDYKRAGQIVDDEMNNIMVKPLPAGCRLTVSTVLSTCPTSCVAAAALPFPCYSPTSPNRPQYDHHGRLKGGFVSHRALARLATPADVISISACKDGQTSADTFADGQAVGAASHVGPLPSFLPC
ncbi:casa protein [Mycena pura]|uniref:Casa protein n=1 Tax=Mycena pura TaxID=153505 RepID=A0AAD6UPY8_9AGAR|nr:casa protein [Mycena pura]